MRHLSDYGVQQYLVIFIHQLNGRHQYKRHKITKLNQENNHVIQYKVMHKAIPYVHWMTGE